MDNANPDNNTEVDTGMLILFKDISAAKTLSVITNNEIEKSLIIIAMIWMLLIVFTF